MVTLKTNKGGPILTGALFVQGAKMERPTASGAVSLSSIQFQVNFRSPCLFYRPLTPNYRQ